MSRIWAQPHKEDILLDRYLSLANTSSKCIFLQFDKPSYESGETIWLSGKVLQVDKMSFLNMRSDLYLEFFDPKKKLITRKLYAVNNGKFIGDLSIPRNAEAGAYIVKSYLLNADGTVNTSSRSYTYLNIKGIRPVDAIANDSELVIEMIPENGRLLSDVPTNIHFRLHRANGAPVSGNIQLKKGDIDLGLITTNALGTARSKVYLKNGEILTASTIIASRTISVSDTAVTFGVQLECKKSIQNELRLNIVANDITSQQLQGRKLYILAHRSATSYLYPLEYSEERKSIYISTVKYVPGIWTFSVFDDSLRFLGRQKTFIQQQNDGSIAVKADRFHKDSISLQLQMKGTQLKEGSLTIYGSSNSTDKDLLLSQYQAILAKELNLGTTDPNVLTSLMNNEELFTEVMHTYTTNVNWEKIGITQKNETIKEVPLFSFSGSIPAYDVKRTSSIFVSSPINGFGFFIQPDRSGHFEFGFNDLIDSSVISFNATSLKQKRLLEGITVKQKNISIDTDTSFPPLIGTIPVSYILPNFDTGTAKLLPNVTVSTVKKNVPDYLMKHPFFSFNDKVVQVTDITTRKYKTLLQLLQAEFGLRYSYDSITKELLLDMGRGPSSFLLRSQPVLVIDEVVMNNLNPIESIMVTDLEAVVVNKTPATMLGAKGAGGSILLITKQLTGSTSSSESSLLTKLRVHGRAMSRPYRPDLEKLDPKKSTHSYYFQPEQAMNKEGDIQLKFRIPAEAKNIRIVLEGVDNNGYLISFSRPLMLN